MIDVFPDPSICACRHTSIPRRTDALLPLAQMISLLCFHLQTPAPEPAQVHSSRIPCLYPTAAPHTDLHLLGMWWDSPGISATLSAASPTAPTAGLMPSLITPPAAFYSSSQTAKTPPALPLRSGPATSISIITTSPPTFLACTGCAACLGFPLSDLMSPPVS